MMTVLMSSVPVPRSACSNVTRHPLLQSLIQYFGWHFFTNFKSEFKYLTLCSLKLLKGRISHFFYFWHNILWENSWRVIWTLKWSNIAKIAQFLGLEIRHSGLGEGFLWKKYDQRCLCLCHSIEKKSYSRLNGVPSFSYISSNQPQS